MADKHYVNEIGTAFIVDTGNDITNASVHKLSVKKPDGTLVEWAADIYTVAGLTRYLRYITVDHDLDQAGQYELQSKVTVDGFTGYGETAQFLVYDMFA